MKKTLLTILCAFVGAFGMAQNTKTYTDRLVVTVDNESSTPQLTNVDVVDNGDGTINFMLKNFLLQSGEDYMPVGNIIIENLVLTDGEAGLKQFTYDSALAIQTGDMEGFSESDWIGPMLGDIPIKLQGKMNDVKLYVTIDIDFPLMGQTIFVQFGTDDFSTKPSHVYTEPLIITINGVSSEPQVTDVTVVDNGDGTINFELKNFFLKSDGEELPVGNIVVENISATEGEDGLKYITYEAPMVIQPGDIEGVDMWIGPMVGEIPLKLQGKMNDEKLFVTIDIDMQEALGQVLVVQVGTDDFSAGIVGDLNGDGKVDIADAVSVLDIMSASGYNAIADLNGDNKIDIADFVGVLDIMSQQ